MVESLHKGYKPWLILSVLVLVGSLVLLASMVLASFYYFGSGGSPLWVTVLTVVAVLGIFAGFGGFVALFGVAALLSWRAERKAKLTPIPLAAEGPAAGE